jgi:hypothetical protein
MADKGQIAQYIELMARNKLGVSVSRLQTLSTTDIDTVIAELKAGSNNAKYRVGGYVGSGDGPIGTLLMTNQQLVVGPLVVDDFFVANEVGIDVTTAGTEGSLYACIYLDRGDGYPGQLLYTTPALTSTPGAFKSTAALTLPLVPGLYWAGCLVNGVITTAPTIRTVASNSRYVLETAGANDINTAGYSAGSLASTPPTSFPSTPAVVAQAPRVMLGVGAT